jgi:hypothetical protein
MPVRALVRHEPSTPWLALPDGSRLRAAGLALYQCQAIVAENDPREAGATLATMLGTTPETAALSDQPGDNSVTARKTRRPRRWKMVGRDGIDPPTPGFSGQEHEARKCA